jgi:hypothetical protein
MSILPLLVALVALREDGAREVVLTYTTTTPYGTGWGTGWMLARFAVDEHGHECRPLTPPVVMLLHSWSWAKIGPVASASSLTFRFDLTTLTARVTRYQHNQVHAAILYDIT